jgi:hypothetical protein
MKQHTKPCGQCPWRRASAPGWLGASTTLEFLFQAEHEPKMPCHATIDYEDEHWQDTADAETAAFVRTVEPDRENVFGMHFEFVSHHGGDESRIMGVLMGLDSGA